MLRPCCATSSTIYEVGDARALLGERREVGRIEEFGFAGEADKYREQARQLHLMLDAAEDAVRR